MYEVVNMAVTKTDSGTMEEQVFGQPYDTTEFYIGLALAISSSVFIGMCIEIIINGSVRE